MRFGVVRTVIVVCLLAVILTGCTENRPQENTAFFSNEETESPAAIQIKPADYFNPYNYATVSDGEDVFYSILTGIYMIPKGNGSSEKIIDGQNIVSITLHNSIIYYIDNARICRVGKNGTNQMTFDVTDNALTVGCLNDTLFISTSKGYYTADVSSDPDVLTLVQSRGRPAPNGVFYSMESIKGTEIGCDLFRISTDTGEATIVLHDVWHREYIITDRNIFYNDEDGVYKADLDGRNSTKIIDRDSFDSAILNFRNYDEQWLYIGLSPGGFNRMDQETGDIEPLFFDGNPGGSDIVDGYIYGYDNGRKVRMKLPDGTLEFMPFE